MRLLLCLLLCTFTWAIPVQTLIENGKQYDQQTVTITGEVIGDILDRGDTVWINVLSAEGTAIGVKTQKKYSTPIKQTGNYRYHGDTISVTGVFSRANTVELGETMLESTQISVLAPGYVTTERFSYKKTTLACLLAILALLFSSLYIHQFLPRKSKLSPPHSKF